ncbi:hypothetical protein IX84_31845 [Phaeodactylibacter xiamenensis]|uniref:Uncharacterized protein n=2 Tax=Phaeodactylibacter xiamenensis TaxID=1524460 RepID=A0A098RZ09_9BACT|nr:hypothetical protein IX84_31845 [Phaeodactylibacter xiamenensis]
MQVRIIVLLSILLFPCEVYSQEIKKKRIENLIEELEHFYNLLGDPNVSTKDKHNSIDGNTSIWFCEGIVMIYNDLEYSKNNLNKYLPLEDYLNFIPNRLYITEIKLLDYRFVPDIDNKNPIDIYAFVEKSDNRFYTQPKQLVISIRVYNDTDFPLKVCSVKDFVDKDDDGVYDPLDKCLFSSSTSVDQDGCTDLDKDGYFSDTSKSDPMFDLDDDQACVPDENNIWCDYDGDGVPNDKDICPDTEKDDIKRVDANGCTDRDRDGYYPDINKKSVNYDPDDYNNLVPQNDNDNIELDKKKKRISKPIIPETFWYDLSDVFLGDNDNDFWFEGQAGINFPLNPFQRRDLFDYSQNRWVDNLGYTKASVASEVSVTYMPFTKFGFSLGFGFFSFGFDEEELADDISTLLSINQISHTNVYVDTQYYFYSYAILKPNMRILSMEDHDVSLSFSPGIGLLNSNNKRNALEGEISGINSFFSGPISDEVSLKSATGKKSIFFKGDLSMVGYLSDYDVLIGGTLSYIAGNYPINPELGFDGSSGIPSVSINKMKVRAFQFSICVRVGIY